MALLKRQLTSNFEDVAKEENEAANNILPNVLMIGTGEYTTGYVGGAASTSDKKAGVVALTMLDLKRRGLINRLGMCGVNGKKFPGIRQHLQTAIGDAYANLNVSCIETFPADSECNPSAYFDAMPVEKLPTDTDISSNCPNEAFKLGFDDSTVGSPLANSTLGDVRLLRAGDAVTIFTPDDTHFAIAMECITRGIHVLITKPVVKTLAHHHLLHQQASKYGVVVAVEVHKRFDPIYVDARDQIMNSQRLGAFSYLYSYMSQPKKQLDTFKAWAGKSSDISYYLNSHHIDFHEWCVGHSARPVSVFASASTGVANDVLDTTNCEDTITLTVQWENMGSGKEAHVKQSLGTAVYTSSWIAPQSDVHSQQRFFYMGQRGEVNVDQAHRGYSMASDEGGGSGFRSCNPLFMKYTPTNGQFSGQGGYGYRSFEQFILAVNSVKSGKSTAASFDSDINAESISLASIGSTYCTTAILEAGRRSLDKAEGESKEVRILYEDFLYPLRPTSLA